MEYSDEDMVSTPVFAIPDFEPKPVTNEDLNSQMDSMLEIQQLILRRMDEFKRESVEDEAPQPKRPRKAGPASASQLKQRRSNEAPRARRVSFVKAALTQAQPAPNRSCRGSLDNRSPVIMCVTCVSRMMGARDE